MSWDTVVVGAGVAGLTAGLRLAQAGQRVAVIAKGVGGTHLAPGTIDVLGYDPERVERPGEAVEALVAERPDHPYAQIGADTIPRALEWFTGQMAEGPLGPYTYLGGTEANLMLPTAVGAVKPSALVPETMAGGEVRHGGRVCVVGFRKLKDFHAALLADNLNRAGMGIEARAVELDLPSSGPADLNALALARQFDKPAFRAEVAGQLVARLRADERLAFPAVLGVADPHAAWTDLQRQLAHPVFEVPTLPPSVSGMRVFATLRGLFGLAGGRFFGNRPVVGAQLEEGRVTAVLARGASRDEPFAADHVVLASGGFASGGLSLDSEWTTRDTCLGLPVAGAPGRDEPRFSPGYFDEHPMARAGIAVDDELRPLDPGGGRAAENVLVAGATLAGAVPWREKSGDGISLSSGFRAAELILGGGNGAAGSAQPQPAASEA